MKDYLIIFLIIILLLYINFKIENFAIDTPEVIDNVKKLIKQNYIMDTEAVRNLAYISRTLTTDSLTLPCNVIINKNLNTINNLQINKTQLKLEGNNIKILDINNNLTNLITQTTNVNNKYLINNKETTNLLSKEYGVNFTYPYLTTTDVNFTFITNNGIVQKNPSNPAFFNFKRIGVYLVTITFQQGHAGPKKDVIMEMHMGILNKTTNALQTAIISSAEGFSAGHHTHKPTSITNEAKGVFYAYTHGGSNNDIKYKAKPANFILKALVNSQDPSTNYSLYISTTQNFPDLKGCTIIFEYIQDGNIIVDDAKYIEDGTTIEDQIANDDQTDE